MYLFSLHSVIEVFCKRIYDNCDVAFFMRQCPIYVDRIQLLEIALPITQCDSDWTQGIKVADVKGPWYDLHCTINVKICVYKRNLVVSLSSMLFSACQPGYFGIDCLEQCGECKDDLYCPFIDGICQHGCNKGYRGQTCQQGQLYLFYLSKYRFIYQNTACLCYLNSFVCRL